MGCVGGTNDGSTEWHEEIGELVNVPVGEIKVFVTAVGAANEGVKKVFEERSTDGIIAPGAGVIVFVPGIDDGATAGGVNVCGECCFVDAVNGAKSD